MTKAMVKKMRLFSTIECQRNIDYARCRINNYCIIELIKQMMIENIEDL